MEASTALSPATIVVRNLTSPGTFSDIELERMVWAVRYQALYHYNRSPWVEHGYATAVADVRLIGAADPIPAGAWLAELLDSDPEQAGALGWHEDQVFNANSQGPRKASGRSMRGVALHPDSGEEIPLIKILCKTTIEDGEQPSEVLSHEVLEAAVDPAVTNEAQIRKYLDQAAGQYYIGEICDAVQGEGYDVGAPEGRPCGVPEATVANFVYPAWYLQPQSRVGVDFRRTRLRAFELAAAGYMSVQPQAGGDWTQIFGEKPTSDSPGVAPPAEHQQRHHEQLVELLHILIRKVDHMEDVLAGVQADEAELATIVPKLVARDEEVSKKLAEFEAKSAAGEVVPTSEVEALKSGFDQSIASLKALLPAEAEPAPTGEAAGEPAAPEPTTEDVSITIAESGEGGATIQHALEAVSIAQQPSSGTASIEAVEGQPDQTYIKVVNATPSTSQVVSVSIAPAPAA